MNLNLRGECLHYYQKELPVVSIRKLKTRIAFRQCILHKFEMPYLEVFVTTHCNLRCKHCSNLIPSLHDKRHIEFTEIKHDIETLLSKIDCLYRIKIHGGEVFLHPQLYDIIDFINWQSKIVSIRITTNGTIIPSDEVLRNISDSKVVVQISDYGLVKSKVPELIAKFNDFGIRYVYLKDQKWFDMGDCRRREKSRYDECTIKRCTSLYNGKIYVCSRAAIMGHNDHITGAGVDINLDKKKFRREIRSLYSGKKCEECFYCDGDTHFACEVPAGEQGE